MALLPDVSERQRAQFHLQHRWLPYRRPQAAPGVRVFCFPCAAASASFFGPWERLVPTGVELCAIQLPGRESRFRETPYTSMEPLISELANVVRPLCDRPCVFFGHSMGARVAFALTQHLQFQDVPLLRLFVAGSSAPHRPSERHDLHALSEERLIEELRRMNGTPLEILQHPETMQRLLPLIRADLAVSETYRCLPDIGIRPPITAFGGRSDHVAPESGLAAWADLTQGTFRLRMFPGGHFFLNDCGPEIVSELVACARQGLSRRR